MGHNTSRPLAAFLKGKPKGNTERHASNESHQNEHIRVIGASQIPCPELWHREPRSLRNGNPPSINPPVLSPEHYHQSCEPQSSFLSKADDRSESSESQYSRNGKESLRNQAGGDGQHPTQRSHPQESRKKKHRSGKHLLHTQRKEGGDMGWSESQP